MNQQLQRLSSSIQAPSYCRHATEPQLSTQNVKMINQTKCHPDYQMQTPIEAMLY